MVERKKHDKFVSQNNKTGYGFDFEFLIYKFFNGFIFYLHKLIIKTASKSPKLGIFFNWVS